MKKILSVALALALLSSGVCYAADAGASEPGDAVSVSLDNMEQLWTDHSPEYAKINSDLKIAKKTFDKLTDANDAMVDAAMYDSTGILFYQAASLSSSRDQAKCAYDVAVAQYDQKIQNAVLAAKQAFLACWQDEWNLSSLQANLARQQARLERFAEGVSNGYLSRKSYDDLKAAVNDLQNSLSGLQTRKTADELTLKSKLGVDADARLAFSYTALSRETFAPIMELDQEEDLAAMLSDSITLKVLQITYDSMNYPSHTYANGAQIDGAKLNLETTRTDLKNGFILLYQDLMNQYADLQDSYRDLERENDKLERTRGQFEKGYVSSSALTDMELEYASVLATVKVRESALYGAYLSYLNRKAGY